MTANPNQPRGINMRGAIDLSGLKSRPQARPGAAGAGVAGPGAAGPGAAGSGPAGAATGPAGAVGPGEASVASVVVDITSANFESVLQLSGTVPVVLDLWADWCQPCTQLSPVLEKLANEGGGTWLLAKIDVEAEKEIAAMLRVQSLPTVLAVIGGRPVPLFQGALPEAQLRQVIGELLTLAAQNGVSGRLNVTGAPAGEPQEPPLSPHHQAAHEAIDNDDLLGAADAFRAALAQDPRDAEATAGLAQVTLLQRISEVDPLAALAAADGDPSDVTLGMIAADVEVASAELEAGFTRLISLIRITAGDEREQLRKRLLDLFEVAGTDDPRVLAARRALAGALF